MRPSTTQIENEIKMNKSNQFSKNYLAYRAHVSLLSRGMMFGDDDAYEGKKYSKTAVCKSLNGEIYAIKAADFVSLVKTFEDSQKEIKKVANRKVQDNIKRIDIHNKIMQVPDPEEEEKKVHHKKFLRDLLNQNQTTSQTISNFFKSMQDRKNSNEP